MANSTMVNEKIAEYGLIECQDCELLSAMINISIAKAKEFLTNYNFKDFLQLPNTVLRQYMSNKNIITLKASYMLMDRQKTVIKPGNDICNSHQLFNLIKHKFISLTHEEFYVIYFKPNLDVITIYKLASGGLTACVVDTTILFNKAIELKAASFTMAHNHPSGNIKPSDVDKTLTARIKKASDILKIRLNDHLIIGTNNDYFSFADGLLITN